MNGPYRQDDPLVGLKSRVDSLASKVDSIGLLVSKNTTGVEEVNRQLSAILGDHSSRKSELRHWTLRGALLLGAIVGPVLYSMSLPIVPEDPVTPEQIKACAETCSLSSHTVNYVTASRCDCWR